MDMIFLRKAIALVITAPTTNADGDTSALSACVPYQFIDRIFSDGFDP